MKSMTSEYLAGFADGLAERWARGHRADVLDQILTKHPPMAAAVAVLVAKNLDELFNEGAAFRAALVERVIT